MAAPTNLTVTQYTTADGPTGQVNVAWEHTGTENRFEVLYKEGFLWKIAALDLKARFGSASPYSYVTGSKPGLRWAVRALTSAGVRTSYVAHTFTGTFDGTWLLPVVDRQVVTGERVLILRDTGVGTRSQSRSEAFVPSRQEAIAQPGALHLEAGVMSGVLMARHELTADEWYQRLERLIEKQSAYDHVLYVSGRKRLKVEVFADLSNEAVQMSGDAWGVSVNYRQVA